MTTRHVCVRHITVISVQREVHTHGLTNKHIHSRSKVSGDFCATMLAPLDTDESAPKRAKQLKPALIDGVSCCLMCHEPVTGRQTFCRVKSPLCAQLYHRKLDRARLESAAFERGHAAGVAQQRQEQALLLQEPPAAETHTRCASLGWDHDIHEHVRFNDTKLDRGVDGWQKTTRTLPIDVSATAHLYKPFIDVAELPRFEEEPNYVKLPWSGKVWQTRLKSYRFTAGGFDSYDSSQHESSNWEGEDAGRRAHLQKKERDAAQRRNIVSFLPWTAWTKAFPKELVPKGSADSATWAAGMESDLLGRVESLFDQNSIPWNSNWRILYIHTLNQAAGACRFRWHRDVEEDSNKLGRSYRLRVHHSVVLLLKAEDNKKVPGLLVAGAPKAAHYKKVMTGHIFNSELWHTTETVSDGECSCTKLGVFIGEMF
jgi:hypothetical protein